MNVGDDTTAGDGGLDEGVELLVTADGELEVAGGDALHLEYWEGRGKVMSEPDAEHFKKALQAPGFKNESVWPIPPGHKSNATTEASDPRATRENQGAGGMRIATWCSLQVNRARRVSHFQTQRQTFSKSLAGVFQMRAGTFGTRGPRSYAKPSDPWIKRRLEECF